MNYIGTTFKIRVTYYENQHFSKNLKKGLDESPLWVYNAPHEGKGVFEVILKDAFFISWEVPCCVST